MSARRWTAVLACVLAWPAQAQEVMEYIHTDALGSVVVVTDQARNVLERREYEPYGKQLSPAVQDGPGYTGHVQDAVTGLVQMQQRYMDPGIGRFLSVDPVTAFAVPGVNFNRYAYAANNPYRFTDPDGRWIRDKDEPFYRGNSCQRARACLGEGGIEARAESDADKAMADVYGKPYSSKDSLTIDVEERLPPVARKHNVELGLRYFLYGGSYFAGDVAASDMQCSSASCNVNLNSSHLDGIFGHGTLVGEYHIHLSGSVFSTHDISFLPQDPFEYTTYLSSPDGVQAIDVHLYKGWSYPEIYHHAERRNLGGN